MGTLAQELTKLQELPEWQALRRHFQAVKARAEQSAFNTLYAGGESAKEIDQRKVDYRRGYLKGTEDFFLYPERLVAQFEKAMERKSDQNG